MRTAALALYTIGALAGWWFVIGYWLRTHGGWRKTPEGWHLMTFTASLSSIFTLLVVVRVAEFPGMWQLFLGLLAAVDAGLVWRSALMQTATRRDQ